MDTATKSPDSGQPGRLAVIRCAHVCACGSRAVTACATDRIRSHFSLVVFLPVTTRVTMINVQYQHATVKYTRLD
jgi:hypothetical protein